MSDAASSEYPCLGIAGLPARVEGLARELVYALLIDQQSHRIPLMVQALHATLEREVPCTLFTPGDPAAFLRKAALLGLDLEPFVKTGDLSLVRQKTDPSLPVFRAGPAAVMELLQRSVTRDDSLVVLDGADSLLFLADPAQAEEAAGLLQQWSRDRRLTVLATFAPASRTPREYLTLRTLAEDFGGLAAMRAVDAGMFIEFRHWFGSQGSQPRTTFALEVGEGGQLHARPATASPAALPDLGASQVIVTGRSVDDLEGARRERGWTVVSSTLEAIDAARRTPAGTVVLDFQRPAGLRALCQAVATIREVGSPYLSIIVRERDLKLRLAHQLALLRLGVSTIVARDADDQGLVLAIQSLAGTAFMRRTATDVDRVLATVSPGPASNLLVSMAFRDTVAEVVAANHGLEMPHSLLHVSCEPARAQQLGALALQRKVRDAALTVDASGLWLFLFGCPGSQALAVAERAFGRHFASVAAQCSVASTLKDIVAGLNRLPVAAARPRSGVLLPHEEPEMAV